MTIPALRALRKLLPSAHITLATRSFARGIFEGADFLDELLVHDKPAGTLSDSIGQSKEWRGHDFDLAILFTNSFGSALIARMARVRCRVGYATESRGFLLTHPVPVPSWRATRHESFYYLNLVSELESLLLGKSDLLSDPVDNELRVPANRLAEAKAFLQKQGVRGERPLIALCPGSINSRAKRWPAERYAVLGDRLRTELDADVILIGSSAELDVSIEVSERMKTKPIMLTGKTDLAQVVAILGQADLLITNDTGPAHIGAALGRPTLVIFGPTNPLTTSPMSPVAEILRVPPDCAPCMLRDCPIDHRCMTAISPEMVFERAVKMMPYVTQTVSLRTT